MHNGEWDRQIKQVKGPSGSASRPWQWSVVDVQGKMIMTRHAKGGLKDMGQFDRDPTLGSKSITETLKTLPNSSII